MRAAATPKGERRRLALASAAADLLREGGFDAVRHRAVAQRASLPLASTTYYFATLEDLLAAAAEYAGSTKLEANRRVVLEITHRRRGADATADLITEVLYPDESTAHTVTAGFERMLGAARMPGLRAVHYKLRAQEVELVSEVLRRSGRSALPDVARRVVFIADGAALNIVCDGTASPKVAASAAVAAVLDVIAPPIPR